MICSASPDAAIIALMTEWGVHRNPSAKLLASLMPIKKPPGHHLLGLLKVS